MVSQYIQPKILSGFEDALAAVSHVRELPKAAPLQTETTNETDLWTSTGSIKQRRVSLW